MTREQFDHWLDFAVRMAKHGYPKATSLRREKILKEVKKYFWWRESLEDWPKINSWDYNADYGYLSVYVKDFFDGYLHWQRKSETYGGRFFNQIICCIRAGFDIAVNQSGGVLGFTAGDLRRMYNEDVPDWITNQDWDTPFAMIPNNEFVWL